MVKKEKTIKEKKVRENKTQYEYTNNISVSNDNISININNEDNDINNIIDNNDNNDINDINDKTSWLYKYKPNNINDIIGNKDEIKRLEKWLNNFKNEKFSSMIISGNHGTGKNIIMSLLFQKYGYIVKQIHS